MRRVFLTEQDRDLAWEEYFDEIIVEENEVEKYALYYTIMNESDNRSWRIVLRELHVFLERELFYQQSIVIRPVKIFMNLLLLSIIYNIIGINVKYAWINNRDCNHITCTAIPALIAPMEVPFRLATKIAAAD
jgi:hypothetical protein